MNRRFVLRLVAASAAATFAAGCLDVSAPLVTTSNVAAAVGGNKIFVDLALGDFHSCGLQSNGEAFCWGLNTQGQSGNGLTSDEGVTTPLVVLGGFQFTNLVAGGSHTCGILVSGGSVCWGGNQGGQLGVGNLINRFEPTAVAGEHAFIALTASTAAHTCGLKANGEAWCWGVGEFGRIGDGTAQDRATPVLVSGGIAFKQISAGGGHTCGITTNGTAYCWGYNERGQLGDGTVNLKLVPTLVSTTLKFTSIVAGIAHTCALIDTGLAYCWGDNVAAALGDGTTESKSTPVPVSGGNAFGSLAVGERHACGLTLEGVTLCWGYNALGSLGDGTYTPVRTAPVTMLVPLAFKKIAAGGYHTCGISLTNVTHCWGDNSGLQLGYQ